MTEKDKPVCGLVMKGGVSSGVVYPPAILQLKEKYRFNQIAGNSAGAIAAAATAAAQFGENSKGDETREGQGFDGLKELSDDLGTPGFIFELFQPQESLRRAWNFLHTSPAVPDLAKALAELKIAGIYYVLALFGFCFGSVVFPDQYGLILGLLLVLHLILAVGSFSILLAYQAHYKGYRNLIEAVKRFTRSSQDYLFGVCSGGPVPGNDEVKPMTVWLHERFQRMAGQDEVLTFKNLESKQVRLRMLSTALTHSKPLGLPFKDRVFLFQKEEMERLFPAEVVQYMIKNTYDTTDDDINCTALNDKGYYFLPNRRELPVIVATRLSLSVPILFCSVPLYTLDYSKRSDGMWKPSTTHIRRSWFTDGGVSCNFPVEVFDEWLPTQPVFGISLGVQDSDKSVEESVHRPKPNEHQGLERTEINSLTEFVNAIVVTTMDQADNAHADLAGSRDRVVEIRLTSNEGGLNLQMEGPQLEEMQKKGVEAGKNLQAADFEDHLWVRLRLFLSVLSKEAQDFSKADFQTLLRSAKARIEYEKKTKQKVGTLSYQPDKTEEWFEKAQEVLELLSAKDKAGKGKVFQYQGFREGAPAGVAGLQVRPRIIGDLPPDS